MRFDTMNAASYLVWRLQDSGITRAIRDDGDLIDVELNSRQRLLIYLIERPMSLSDVQYHLKTNTAQAQHTLFLFWVDMLLPRDGTLYYPDDWMQAVMSLHNDKIYGFEVAGREAYFIPIHFEGKGYQRRIRYGGVVDYRKLHAYSVETKSSHLTGTWRVADFSWQAKYAHTQQPQRHPLSQRAPQVVAHFKTLGIAVTEDTERIKRTYRQLARQYHPDVNPSADAMQRMRTINQAYRAIMDVLANDT